MKNIYLIGDSICYGAGNSTGYGVVVKKRLEGIANVLAPDDNCRFAQYTLRYLFDWAQTVDCDSIDIVHWNNGLWDVLRLNGDEPLSPPEIYVYMLKRVHNVLIRTFKNAKIIFATSTVVIEEMASPDFFRYNREIKQYNRDAARLMDELRVEVNDLYEVSRPLGREYHADWVHYNDLGSDILADAVIKKLKPYL